MISSEEFNQKLQAGQIHEALALVMRDAMELDVTTRMTEAAMTISHPGSEYLRTKINLLTGDVQNEVGKDVIIDSTSYLKLQQLHLDQIIASHRIVKSYLDRIQSIFTVLPPSPPSSDFSEERLVTMPTVESDRLNSNSLLARLTQLTAMPMQNPSIQQFELTTVPDSTFTDCQSAELTNSTNLSEQQQSQLAINNTIESIAVTDNNRVLIDLVAVDDDNLDLSIDRDGTVWEEWVEDEDLMPELVIPQPPVLPIVTMPDWEENSVRQQLNPIEVKPIIPRSTAKSVDSSAPWDKFGPEYVGIITNPQSQLDNNSNSDQIDRLLADLDI